MKRLVLLHSGVLFLTMLMANLASGGHKLNMQRPEVVDTTDTSNRIIDPNDAYDQSWAVIIGINQFDDPGITPLNSAEDDASRMKSLL